MNLTATIINMKASIIVLLLSLTFFSSKATIYYVSANLSGANEATPNASIGYGNMTGTFNDVTHILTF